MAKKRKLRSSEPEPAIAPEPQPDPETPQEQQIQEEEEAQQHQYHSLENMAVDDTKEEEEDEEEEEEEEEEEDDEEEEEESEQTLAASKNGSVSIGAANGGAGEENEGDNEPLETLLEPFSKEQLTGLLKQAVSKYPEFIKSVRHVANLDPAHRKIFVHGLGWDTTSETLISEFGKYGEIEDCKAVTDRVSGKSKGYAFILFKHRSGARKALKEPQKRIGNRTASCQLASAGPVPAPPPTTLTPMSEYTQRKIFVSNVAADIEPDKLVEFFKQFGEIEEGPLGLDKQTGKPKGFALFVYKSVESAKKALEVPHKNFGGHTLHCQRAIDGPKPGKPYHQQQNQNPHQQHHHQPHYYPRKEKNKYSSGGAGPGHLMAPSGPSAVGFNPGVAAQALNPALGQALTALLATQGAGLGLGNLLGGLGGGAAPVNQAGPPTGYGNQVGAGYGNQVSAGYGNQQGMQGGYQNPQMGQGSAGRPQQGGGAPYMGH